MNLENKLRNLSGPILIIGASGFIGANLFRRLLNVRSDVFGTVFSGTTWRLNGLPSENLFPYTTSRFKTLPPYTTYQSIPVTPQKVSYNKIAQNEAVIKNNLYSGNPIIFGINVYESFMLKIVETTGIIPYPNRKIQRFLGGHCVLMIGWTTYKNQEYFIIRNSWGTIWGNMGETKLKIINGSNGYGYIPKTYILDPILAFDFYAIKLQ